jgi:hypothetical protein
MWEITQHSAVLFFIAWDIAWFVISCLRIPHYLRVFQHEGYDKKRYYDWYRENRLERHYRLLSVGFVLLGLVTIMLSLALNVLFVENLGGIIANTVLVALALFAFWCAPRSRAINSPLTLNAYAARLLLTAYALEAIPVFISGFVFSLFFDGPFQSGSEVPYGCIIGLFWGVPTLTIAIATGMISHFMTPVAVPLANLINGSIDAMLSMLRRQFPSR